tara:strand:- start:252 stop:1211 length:960 start_codon:yes stop_codon:yes gene_type:complete
MTVEKFHIKKISEIDREKLIKFYQNTFQYEKPFSENYNWRYRAGFNEFEPLVLLINNEICGHAGLIPVDINFQDERRKAIWFTDFHINSKFRSRGYGKLLTQEWMKICPIHITICNDQSLKVFKKLNWSSSQKFIRRIKFNNYLRIIPMFRKFNDFNLIKSSQDNLKLLEINNSTLTELIASNNIQGSKKGVYLVRDESWFKWRLIDCPYKKNIYIFKFKDDLFITHLKFKNNLKILNIIYSSAPISNEISNIFINLSKKNNVDYLSFISNKKKLLDNFFPWEKKLNFAFNSEDEKILKMLNKELNDIQFIDSDIDFVF